MLHCVSFPTAAVTNYHKLGSLNQHKGIIFLEVRVQNESHQAEIQVAGLCSFWRLSGRIHFLP